jgi:hypothetical protein
MKLATIHEERAQGVIEFALIISILMLIFLGTVDFARFLYYDTAIRTAARVGDEAAINHCASTQGCGEPNLTTYDFVLQKTTCEPQPYVQLQPGTSSITCTPVAKGGTPCVGGTSSCPSACSLDICVSPAYAPGSDIAPPSASSNTAVTVTVGYNFKPISFLMAPFFKTTQCWSGDTTTHTICASAVGRES